jgi:nucleotide-binding universal stress UspA family protein
MYQRILVPLDLAEVEIARPAIKQAMELAKASGGTIHLLNVLSLTPVMLAEYVPADFDTNQRQTAEETMKALVSECALGDRVTSAVRQGGIYHEILEEAKTINADLIVMTSHRPAMRTYFLGSNAGHVVRYAKCSVLVVRN